MDLITYLEEQSQLERNAKEFLPGNIDECTYSLGQIRQSLFACVTCQNVALCEACAVKCHTTHTVVELSSKRNTACDCGTTKTKSPCFVRYPAWETLDFKDYTPDTAYNNKYCHNYQGKFCCCDMPEDNEKYMVQCILGDACNEDWYHDTCILNKNIDLDSFETLICWKCVAMYPKQIEILKNILNAVTVPKDDSYTLLLKEDFKQVLEQHIQDNDEIKEFLENHPYLYSEDPIYEPHSDTDSTSSLFELGLKQINKVPVEQVSKGLEAYDNIKSKLTEFLKPFAETGHVVTEDEIKDFFKTIQN